MTKKLRILFVFLMVLITFRFFDARFLDKHYVNVIVFLFSSIAIVLSLCHFRPKSEGFVLPVQLIVVSIIISMFISNQLWGQNIKEVLILTIPFLTWVFFFYLLYIQISPKTLEKIIIVCGLLYIILFFFQFANAPKVLFGKSIGGWEESDFSAGRGIVRIVFPGGGIFYLITFMAINKLTTQSKRKWLWGSLTILGLIIPILQVTRQFIFGVCLIYLFHFTKKITTYKKIIILGLFVGLSFFVMNLNNPLVEGLSNITKQNLNKGEDYVRVQAGAYFLTDFSPTTLNKLFGNGASDWSTSDYGSYINNIKYLYGYDLSDVGIIGMYAMFGILAVIGYIMIWIKSFTISLPDEYQYLKYYLWLLLITSLTWYSVFSYEYLIATVFTLYLYHTIGLQNYSNPPFQAE